MRWQWWWVQSLPWDLLMIHDQRATIQELEQQVQQLTADLQDARARSDGDGHVPRTRARAGRRDPK